MFAKRCVYLFMGALVLLASWTPLPARAESLSYVDLLHELTDFDRLTRPHPGITAGQFSSWDRGELKRWGSNGDAGQYLRVEADGEAVMMDIDGPGCIYRTWSANPQGKIRIYLDGATKPTYEWDFNRIFTEEQPPFIKPLVYKRDGPQSASDCYVPIPFARHIKITADRKYGQYYHFDYHLFPKGWTVPSFHLPLSAEEETALQAAAAAWAQPTRDPKPVLPGQQTVTKQFTLAPGATVAIADLTGPGIIRSLRAKVTCQQRSFWRKIVLRGVWDGASWPQILSPLGPFFGFDWQTADYTSLVAGCRDGEAYFHYPMPFHQTAHLELQSFLAMPAEVEMEVTWAPVSSLPADTLYFFAHWRHEPDSTTFDYPFIETAGHGQFVGVSLQIDHPSPGWWGEGDEKIWVDDDDFPPWIGTGSEDYFGDAWGIRYLPEPSFGCSFDKGHLTCPFRWHFMDYVPFTKRFRMTIENYPPDTDDYASVAYWYQAEKVPPFAELRGVHFTGGLAPNVPPTRLEYSPSVFPATLDAAQLHTFGLAVPDTLEAETMFRDAIAAGKAKRIDDALLPYSFNMEQAVDFGTVKAGQDLGEFTFDAPETTVYYPVLWTAPEQGIADLGLEIDGKRLQPLSRLDDRRRELSGLALPAGKHTARLIATGDGHAVLDCIQLQRAMRADGAMEAEDMPVVRVTAGAPQPQPSAPLPDVSAGRILEWHATAPEQAMVIRIDAPHERPYVLGVLPMLGPAAGIIQAFVDGKPIGPQFDLYAAKPQRGTAMLPLGPLPTKTHEVEIRVVGKNSAAQGFHVGLDYFRFEPQIIGPGSAPGVWAQILATKRGHYRIQDLGGEWFGGHHLWLQPSAKNASVDIGLQIPAEGDYDIVAHYTTSWDYAIIQAALDGKALSNPVDCYTPQVLLAKPITLGKVHLTAGRHILRFTAADKNERSRGYLMGIDYVSVKAAG